MSASRKAGQYEHDRTRRFPSPSALVRSFRSPFLKRKKDAHYKSSTRDRNGTGVNFPEIYFQIYLSLSSNRFERIISRIKFFSFFVHSNVRRNCETFLIDSELSEVIDEMENIRENTRVRKSVMDTREQLEHGCAKSFRDRGAIYTRETKTPNRGVKV